MDKYIVVGLGVFGFSLAQNLIHMGAEVVVVDSNMELVEEIQDKVTYSMCLDTTDEKALGSIGLEDFDVGIVCIGENFEACLLTAVLFKQKGVKKVIARATNPTHIKILKAVGIDQIVSPGMEAAQKLAYGLVYKSMLDIIQIGEKMAAAKILVPADFVGKTIGELKLRPRFGINVIAIHRKATDEHGGPVEGDEQAVNTNPSADTVIKENDILMVIGDVASLNTFVETI